MIQYDRKFRALATALATVAGYVDACGFLATGGVFVSFMSGNSTKLGVNVADRRFEFAGLILGVILLFLVGVILGTIVSRRAGRLRKFGVLLFVSMSLIAAAIFLSLGLTYPGTAAMVVAMGALNAVFQRDGEVTIGLTYMTGTLVKLGQQIASAFSGGPRNTWQPYAFHWAGMMLGAVLGAVSHQVLRAHSLWPACAAALALSFFARGLQQPVDVI